MTKIERKFIKIIDNHAVVEVTYNGKEKSIEIWQRLAPRG